jgi:hypothetical protein
MVDLPDVARLVRERLDSGRPLEDTRPEWVGGMMMRQLTEVREEQPRMRMSALGKCARALSYRLHETPTDGRTIDARAKMTFLLGDVVEAVTVLLLSDALRGTGWRLADYATDQRTVELWVDQPLSPGEGMNITGHPDGILLGPDGERYVLEVKSTSSYGFLAWQRRVRDGQPAWDETDSYWWQTQGYIHAMGADGAICLAVGKEHGAILSWHQPRDEGYLSKVAEHLHLASLPPEDAPRMLPCGTQLVPVIKLSKRDGVTHLKGHGALPFQCQYCDAFRTCRGPQGLREERATTVKGAPTIKLFIEGGA